MKQSLESDGLSLCELQEGVSNTDKAFQCESCEADWEHVECIRECECPDDALYDTYVQDEWLASTHLLELAEALANRQ